MRIAEFELDILTSGIIEIEKDLEDLFLHKRIEKKELNSIVNDYLKNLNDGKGNNLKLEYNFTTIIKEVKDEFDDKVLSMIKVDEDMLLIEFYYLKTNNEDLIYITEVNLEWF